MLIKYYGSLFRIKNILYKETVSGWFTAQGANNQHFQYVPRIMYYASSEAIPRLDVGSANERRRYNVTPSLIGLY